MSRPAGGAKNALSEGSGQQDLDKSKHSVSVLAKSGSVRISHLRNIGRCKLKCSSQWDQQSHFALDVARPFAISAQLRPIVA